MHDTAIELLAPAGTVAALHAAVGAGADAVYLGLEHFNARRGAENFTMPTFRTACEYAHLRGVRIYVTLNTEILPSEWKAAMECARQAWRAGADAFIVQDIGLAAEIRRTLPEVRLHISTQMNTHNLAGIHAAAALGASRVTLAREMSLEEIRVLVQAAREEGLEVETFAHGALCICYSGQCFMSSMIGGRSANRGMCAQACRLPYELRNTSTARALPSPGEHLLSPKDLCSVDMLGELVDAGVSSLKIEGRMKSPEYVSAVVGVYRAVLDRVLATRAKGGDGREIRATQAEKNALAEAFSRGFTTAYLTHDRGNDIMSYQRPNNRGVAVGRVARVAEDALWLAPTKRLATGDVLEVWTGKGRATVTVAETKAGKDGLVKVPFGKIDRELRAVRKDDRIFRVRSAEAAFADDALEPRVAVDGRVVLRLGSAALVEFWPADWPETAGEEPVGSAAGAEVEPARTKAVTAEEVRDHVDRLGSAPFALRNLDVEMDEGVGIGFGALHQLRASALEELTRAMLAPWAERLIPKTEPRETPAAPLSARGVKPFVAAFATNPVCARNAKKAGAEVVYVSALNMKRGEGMIAGQLSATADSAGYPKAAVVALPVVDHDPLFDEAGEPVTREADRGIDVWEYVAEGKPVLAESWPSLVRALEEGAAVEAGPHIPVTNTLTLQTMADLGVARVWLSPELTLSQIEELSGAAAAKAAAEPAAPPLPLGITVIGTTELMTTEHCLLMSQGTCAEDCARCPRRKSPHVLKDRMDAEFPVFTDALGRSHLMNSVQLDTAHVIPDLLAAGVTAFMVDTTLMNGEEAAQAVGRAVHALDLAVRHTGTVAKVNGATTGHLFRGVS